MVKEIIDNENSKKNSKNLTGNTSSKLKNTLKANTAEEEYLSNCEVEIEETENKLKEKRNELEEARKALPEYKEKVLEEFSI
jgi:flagellar biosynthesis chaperone FliJ